ncbi:MAG: sulfatase [Alphaproteobacteria bacterium]|nr:sulfatase [Alphaproteobacteria bacterium]
MDRRVPLVAMAGLLAGAIAASLFLFGGEPNPVEGEDAGFVVVETDARNEALPPAQSGAPHVVVVLGCTVRRDQVSPYGGHPEATPFLSELAARGTLFEDPIAAAPWTRAASAAILTGHHALELGMVEPGPDRNERRLPGSVETLAERFRAAGYTTVGASTNPNLNAAFGFAQGFDRYVQLRQLWRDNMVKLDGTDILSDLVAQIDTRPDPDRPLYLQVMLVDAHAPFDPPAEDLAPVREDGVPDEVNRYRGELRGLDRSIRALHDALVERGFTDDRTLFVFASDHGEGLLYPPHHGRSHGRYLYNSAVETAWIAAGPGVAVGHRVAGPASQVDIAPTLLGFLGLPGPDGEGLDLSAALRGGAETGRDIAYTDTWFMTADRAGSYDRGLACMRSFSEEAVDDAPTGRFVSGCYDRVGDPHQLAPVEPTPDDRMVGLIRWRSDTSRRAPSGEVVEVGSELDEQLRALGYAQQEGTP